MKSNNIKASVLEKILLLGIVAILGVNIAAYYYLSDFVKTQAQAADHSMISAQSSQKNISSLNKSYQWIKDHPDTVQKTDKIVAEVSFYKYQDQIINDLEAYGNQVGLPIESYSFNENAAAAATPTGSAPAAATSAATTAVTGSTKLPSNLTTTTVDIGFADKGKIVSGVPFKSVLLFMKKIEQNVTRMQITSLTLTPTEKDQSRVTVSMTVSVFLNKGP